MAKKGMKTSRLAVAMDLVKQVVTIKHEKRNGEKFEVVESKDFAFATLPENVRKQVSLYGLNKLLQDRTSQFRSLGIEKSFAEIGNVYDTLLSGVWSAARKPSQKAEGDDPVLVAVLAGVMNKPVAVVAAMFAKLEKARKDALAKQYADQVAVAKQEAEGDLDDFFEGFEELESE